MMYFPGPLTFHAQFPSAGHSRMHRKCGTRSFDRVIHATDSRLSSHSRLSSNAFSMVIAGTIRQAALQRDGEGHNPCSYISIARRFVISKFELRNRFLQEQTERRSRRRIASSKSQSKKYFGLHDNLDECYG